MIQTRIDRIAEEEMLPRASVIRRPARRRHIKALIRSRASAPTDGKQRVALIATARASHAFILTAATSTAIWLVSVVIFLTSSPSPGSPGLTASAFCLTHRRYGRSRSVTTLVFQA